jgi:GTPase SAR1 family protein
MSFINPFRKMICPFCFEQFYPAECRVLSSREGQELLKEAPGGFAALVARFWLDPLSGTKNTEALAARQCPRCEELLPYNFEYMQNQIVGLVGGVASGKSHYIASLVHELKRGDVNSRVGCTRFMPVNQDVDTRYNKSYGDPVFVRKEPLSGNLPLQAGQRNLPLIYEMIFEGRKQGEAQKLVNLSLFDASGEQIQNEQEMVIFHRYLLNASALIVLVDPITMPDLRERLPHHLRPDAVPSHDAFDILNTVIRTYERYRGYRPGTPIDIPVVITLAKSDLVRYGLEGLGLQANFLRDGSYEEGFSLDDFEAVSEEVQEIIARYAGRGLIDSSKVTFPNLAFSAVSATGSPPDSSGSFSVITPRRVLDPLLWSLWKLNIITANKHAIAPSPVPSIPQQAQAMR